MHAISDLQLELSPGDDVKLWDNVLAHLLSWLEPQISLTRRRALFIRLGLCSHWNRPHYWRHTIAGSKGWPRGYGGGAGLPELDWSILLRWKPKDQCWLPAEGIHTKRYYLLQVAIPLRSVRHNQALVHSRWLPGPRSIEGSGTLFFFQKASGSWQYRSEHALSM